eukprot:COSAG01_NODE_254_length_20214_cov_25.086254_11_plen_181_part_00
MKRMKLSLPDLSDLRLSKTLCAAFSLHHRGDRSTTFLILCTPASHIRVRDMWTRMTDIPLRFHNFAIPLSPPAPVVSAQAIASERERECVRARERARERERERERAESTHAAALMSALLASLWLKRSIAACSAACAACASASTAARAARSLAASSCAHRSQEEMSAPTRGIRAWTPRQPK